MVRKTHYQRVSIKKALENVKQAREKRKAAAIFQVHVADKSSHPKSRSVKACHSELAKRRYPFCLLDSNQHSLLNRTSECT
jgi:predicted transposase YdaD